jgi:hypothetical protein
VVLAVFPSTVLFPRDKKTAAAPVKLSRPKLLSVMIELETLTVATPVELLCATIPLVLLDAIQFSTLSSAGADVLVAASKPMSPPEATLFRTVTLEFLRATIPSPALPPSLTWSTDASAFPAKGWTSMPVKLFLMTQSFISPGCYCVISVRGT